MGASHANETVTKASFTSLINLLIFPQKRLDQTAYSCIVLQSNNFTSDETVAGKANVNETVQCLGFTGGTALLFLLINLLADRINNPGSCNRLLVRIAEG